MEKPFRCVIVEDEPLAILHLESLINKQGALTILGYISAIEDIVNLEEDIKNADILFLDLKIIGGNVDSIKEHLSFVPYIIVTSAFSKITFPAFIQQRPHFNLPKPITSTAFKQCIEQLFEHISDYTKN